MLSYHEWVSVRRRQGSALTWPHLQMIRPFGANVEIKFETIVRNMLARFVTSPLRPITLRQSRGRTADRHELGVVPRAGPLGQTYPLWLIEET